MSRRFQSFPVTGPCSEVRLVARSHDTLKCDFLCGDGGEAGECLRDLSVVVCKSQARLDFHFGAPRIRMRVLTSTAELCNLLLTRPSVRGGSSRSRRGRNLSTYLRPVGLRGRYWYSAEATSRREGTLGKRILPSLQSRAGRKIGCCLYVRADRRHQATAKIGGATNVFLPAVLCLFGHGPSARGRSQYRRLGHDPRSGRFGPRPERSCLGESQGDCRFAIGR
jgi:hypothetical protein